MKKAATRQSKEADKKANEDARIQIRVSKEQKEMLTKAAKAEGLQPGQWLRMLGLREVRQKAQQAHNFNGINGSGSRAEKN